MALHLFQDWGKELRRGFRESDLSKQCTHRYKIYIEGRGWSVSEKYILACDSVALMVRPRFHDFFSRGLAPLRHYWPVRDRGVATCRSIKFAVDSGNAHPDKAREIGRNASRFVREDLAMGRVYDYMFHLLAEYARLLRYRPAVPRGAGEVTVESMARGLERQFMVDTMVADNGAGGKGPCRLPPPFSSEELEAPRRERADVVRQVEAWEDH
ncbi:O-glucosyltransferase rumi-like isoform X2 [Panicum miliaceum]|uniref:O-glucosyltransferase rumi-like isoform X2 n=1 Tax=Panicum miliaceum TaxID=4540 RepID=A0A3L6Q8H5_PANMI|nr:O-glucosyltransferase rumi-like isoform X2 [Panicum miliaceum]